MLLLTGYQASLVLIGAVVAVSYVIVSFLDRTGASASKDD